ncbi:unnamed protein product [Clavelina lepadiformis]|uniref:DUF7041 domain-containing protein n=1 Tax=Clavelina lepadiformis TaxID=159417 RepID=A0ABP0GBW4_CLALP
MSSENEERSAEPSSNEAAGSSGLGADRKELISVRTQDTTSRNDLFSHVKLPTFWKFNPEAWISHLEHKFSLYRIASQTNRYLLAVEAIPATDLALLRLPSASAQDCYDILINEILRNFDKREDHLDFLLADLTLHGQSPKHLMRELMSAVGQENLTPPVVKLIRAKFLKALPPDVAIALASVKYENLQSLAMHDPPIPDSPDSPDEQPAPAPQPSIIRPGEQGSDYPLPGRREMAFLKQTVLHPVYKYYEILSPEISHLTKHSDISPKVLAFSSPPTTSAEDLELWFQRLEAMFDLVPQISFETKIFTMIGATAAVQSTDLLRFFLRLRNTVPIGTQAYEQFKSYLKHRLMCETPTKW